MAFLTPAFLLGLGAIAIPVLVHLIQREKKRVIEFPSLMFVRRIPYQSVRRRRIRHWALLLLRAAAIALLVAAFARAFIRQSATAAAAPRYGPALKLAESILSRSPIKRRAAVLISDFQRSGWSGSEEVRFPEEMSLSTVSVASPNTANLAVPSVTFARASFSGQERLTVTAGLSNKGDEALKDVPVTLTIDGHEIQTEKASVAAHASGSVSFTQFTLTGPNIKGMIHAGSDALPADNN